MKKPMIIMVHRVECNHSVIEDLYYKRNLVINIVNLIEIIKKIIESGYSFGSLKQAIETNNHLHITFDDGYKEHLFIAKVLKNKFDLKKGNCSFAINVSNSILSDFSGMDLIYNLINYNSINEICYYFSINNLNNSIDLKALKKKYIKMSVKEIENIKNTFVFKRSYLKNQFMNKKEVVALSNLFTIVSHGIYHRDLRFHKESSKEEILNSKKYLEILCDNHPIEVFCYPEGKNDKDIWNYCKDSGYKYGLSINHDPNNPYKIGRYCINRHLDDLLRELNAI